MPLQLVPSNSIGTVSYWRFDARTYRSSIVTTHIGFSARPLWTSNKTNCAACGCCCFLLLEAGTAVRLDKSYLEIPQGTPRAVDRRCKMGNQVCMHDEKGFFANVDSAGHDWATLGLFGYFQKAPPCPSISVRILENERGWWHGCCTSFLLICIFRWSPVSSPAVVRWQEDRQDKCIHGSQTIKSNYLAPFQYQVAPSSSPTPRSNCTLNIWWSTSAFTRVNLCMQDGFLYRIMLAFTLFARWRTPIFLQKWARCISPASSWYAVHLNDFANRNKDVVDCIYSRWYGPICIAYGLIHWDR